MKPPSGQMRKLGDLRVTRKTNVELTHGDSHGWAVSYADLLMVMLSFFVLYFSFSDTEVDNQMARIALSMQGKSEAQIDALTRTPASEQFADLSDALKIEGVKVTKNSDHLLVELENGAFHSGKFEIDRALKAQVDQVFDHLQPFKDSVFLTVIGHADKKPMIPQNTYLQDNFDLSSLRALHVLKYIIAKGFPANRASARAASSYDRDARSITIEIRPARGEGAS